jgi:thiol-disulfide isomerase/thioredoxin
MTSPDQASEMHEIIRRGPMTIILVFSTTCPHCTSYMPLWKQLSEHPQKKANMISMQADVYQQTTMAKKKPVSGVPTVLFVNKKGQITEGKDIRNSQIMTTAVEHGVSEDVAVKRQTQTPAKRTNTQRLSADDPIFDVKETSSASDSMDFMLSEPPTPGSSVRRNPLPAVPAQVVPSPQRGGAQLPPTQSGGSPWAAFVAAARQAGPAVALLGAYGLIPRTERSSGLGPARRSTRRRRPLSRRSRRNKTRRS